MKQLKWTIVDKEGKQLEWCRTRESARDAKNWYIENIFHDWIAVFVPPLTIVREEWELVGKKVVR